MAQQKLTITNSSGADARRVLDLLTPLNGDGAPTADAAFIGQIYVDETADVGYLSIQVGTGATDWKQITNV